MVRHVFASLAFALLLPAAPAFACASPICVVAPETLPLAHVITFDDQASGMGPGVEHRDVLALEGARFGEHFLGQMRGSSGDFDVIAGPAAGPLRLLPGPAGELFSIHRLGSSNVINGFGPARFPKREAQGEGALAILFDDDQPALSFDVLGGEDGIARITFLRRDGSLIDMVDLTPLSDKEFGFMRPGLRPDIAGIVITNSDPEGIAIDNLRFGAVPQLG